MPKPLGTAALFAALVFCAAPRTGAEDKPASLEGTYTVVGGEENGKPTPPEKVKGSVVRFTKDTITGHDKDKKEFFAAKYTVDTSKKPWAIKMKSTAPKEAEAVGLVKRDGDTVTLIYALPGAPAPTEFKTGDRQNMFILKAAKTASGK
jgi:uncharacterized protein (TIGR03067 family)